MSFDIVDEFERLISALQANRIDYAVCGGFACAIHGHVRETRGIDLLILPEALVEACKLASELGFDREVELEWWDSGTPRLRCVRHCTKVSETDRIPLALLLVAPVFKGAWEKREAFAWRGHIVWCVSLTSLVAMKRLAGRERDLEDIERLGSLSEDDLRMDKGLRLDGLKLLCAPDDDLEDDAESVLLELTPSEPTALSKVVEWFAARSELTIAETHAALTNIGKVTKLGRPGSSKWKLSRLHVQLPDRAADGWLTVTHAVWCEVLRQWPDEGSRPPEDVLLKRVLPHASKIDFETILFESIPPEPTPFPKVVIEFRKWCRLPPSEVRLKIFGVLANMLINALPHGKRVTEAELTNIQVHFSDRPDEDWQPINAATLADISARWPATEDLPPRYILIKRSLMPARVNSAALKVG